MLEQGISPGVCAWPKDGSTLTDLEASNVFIHAAMQTVFTLMLRFPL